MILQPADILLFRVGPDSSLLDKLIGWGQKVIRQAPTESEYCHVALIGPSESQIYEARWPKIHNIALEMPELLKRNPVEVYRVKNLTPEQTGLILGYAKGQVGQWYDLSAIFTMGMVQLGHTAVCSQFVWNAFTAAGICLCTYESLLSPDDIAASHLTVRVE